MRWMNRLFLALTLGATLFCSHAYAQANRQALSGYCEDGGQTVSSAGVTSTTKVQRSYPGCTVTVYVSGTATLATIYADLAGTPKANPFTANGTTGYWFFYADPARFDVQLSGAGMTTVTRGGLWIVAGGGGGGGVSGSGTTNTIPKWTSSSALGDSIITEVGGTQARVGGDLLVTGAAGISTSPSSSNSLTISKTFSSGGSYNGILTNTILQSINGVGSSYAGRFILTTSGTTVNATDLGGLRVIASHTGSGNLSENYGIYSSISQSGSGTMTDPIGIRSDLSLGISLTNQLTNFKATGTLSAGTHQQYIDFLSKPPTLSGGAAITNMYGFAAFSAPSVASGITNYYPFYSIQGIASFGSGAATDRLELRSGLPLRLWNPTDLGYSEIVQNSAPAGNYRYYWPADAPVATDALTVSGVSGSNVTLAWSPGGGSGTNVRKALNVVTDYSCIGNGVADDTACIGNALTAAAAAGGYKVYLPAGTYLVTGLTFTGQIEVEGDGDGKTIIYSTTNAPIVNVDPNGSFRGPTIRNLTIRGSVSAGGSQIGLNVDDATYVHSVRVSNVTIENTGDYGLYVGNAFSSTFENMFISNTADYPLLYNASQMPQNRFESIYIGDLRSGVTSGFRIKAGDFHCTNCNGVNTVVANSWWATLGKKAGTDGDISNGAAYAHWDGGNAESTVAGGIRHYYNSQSTIGPGFQFAGDASGSGSYVAMLYEVDSAIFPPQFSKGMVSDKAVFANSPASYFSQSQPIHSNDIPPVMIEGQGLRVAGGDNVLSYYDSTKTKALPLTSSGGFFETYTVTATANGEYDRPGIRMIKANCGAACQVEIPWPGWYRAGETLTIYDASNNAATNNITVAVDSGGTINGGATYVINRNKESITLVPDETGTDWRIVTDYPGGKVPFIQGGGTPNLDFYTTWSATTGQLSLTSGLYTLGTQSVFMNDVFFNTDNADDIGTSGGNRPRTVYAATGFSGPKYTVAGNIFWSSGAGSPEGVVTADIGSLYSRNNGASNTTIYAKTSGGGNTGWEPLINTGGGGGSIGGTIAANQVAFGTAADTIGGDNDLQWDNSAKNLTVVGHASVTQDNTATVPFSVQAVAASSAELAQFKDSGGNVRGGYSTAGAFFFRGFSSAPTASLANDGKLFYDITGGVTNQQLLLSKNTGTYNPVVTAEQASFTANRLVKWSATAGSWQATDISGATSDGTSITVTSGNLRATRPRFTTSIDDANGNESIILTATASAVNEITLANAATGGIPSITASGGDTNVSLRIDAKGTGGIGIGVNPAASLHVKVGSIGTGFQVDSASGAISGVYTSDGSSLLLGGTTNHTLELMTNSTTRLSITGAGAANFTGALTIGGVTVPTISSTNTISNKTLDNTNSFSGYFDATRISAPSNPSSGSLRVFANNSTGKLACLDSSGADCMPSGGSPAGSTGDYQINNGGSFGAGVLAQGSTGRLTATPTAASSGVAPYLRIITPADTGQTADTEFPGIVFGGNSSGATVTRTGADGTTLATQREYIFTAPTYAFAGATTITTAATVAITGEPTAGTNATITKPLALLVSGRISSPGSGTDSERFGAGSSASGTSTIAIGNGASAGSGVYAIKIGAGGSSFSTVNGVAIGGNITIGNAAPPIAIGGSLTVSGSSGIVIAPAGTVGSGTSYVDNSVVIGQSASVAGNNPSWTGIIALGHAVVATGSNQFVAGSSSYPTNNVWFGKGITNATPTAYTINGTGGSGSNIAGADVIIAGGKHTGTPSSVATGNVRLQTSVVGAASSTLNSLVDRLVIANRKALTDASATSLFDATCASNTACGGTVEATIIATDGTEYQTRTVVLTYQAVNKGGTLTSSVTVVSETAAVSSGTLTGTWSASNGSGKITIQLNADTSLTSTALYVIYNVKNNSEQAITIL